MKTQLVSSQVDVTRPRFSPHQRSFFRSESVNTIGHIRCFLKILNSTRQTDFNKENDAEKSDSLISVPVLELFSGHAPLPQRTDTSPASVWYCTFSARLPYFTFGFICLARIPLIPLIRNHGGVQGFCCGLINFDLESSKEQRTVLICGVVNMAMHIIRKGSNQP